MDRWVMINSRFCELIRILLFIIIIIIIIVVIVIVIITLLFSLDFLSPVKEMETPKKAWQKIEMMTPQNWAIKFPQDVYL